jgi:hypothetical protein
VRSNLRIRRSGSSGAAGLRTRPVSATHSNGGYEDPRHREGVNSTWMGFSKQSREWAVSLAIFLTRRRSSRNRFLTCAALLAIPAVSFVEEPLTHVPALLAILSVSFVEELFSRVRGSVSYSQRAKARPQPVPAGVRTTGM